MMRLINEAYTSCCAGHTTLADTKRWIKLAAMDDVNDDLIQRIFKGDLKAGELHLPYYFDVAGKLTLAIQQGLKKKVFEASKSAVFEKFRQNVFAFSSAKSFTLMKQYTDNLKDEKGELRSYSQFRNQCVPVGEVFNDNHLRAEYNMAVAKTQMANKWDNMQKYSMLKFRTAGDNKVRASHAKLDGTTLPKDHPFWREYWPPLDWGCRCTVIPADGQNNHMPEDAKLFQLPAYFKGNAGIEHVVFSHDMPQFNALQDWIKSPVTHPIKLDAERNYAMRAPEKIVLDNTLPAFDESAIINQGVKFTAPDGIAWDAGNDVIRNADEVWVQRDKTGTTKHYIKYYQGKPTSVSYDVTKPQDIEPVTHAPDETGKYTSLRTLRKGQLLYRK